MSGTYAIHGHSGKPCTYYKTQANAGNLKVCGSKEWATGLFVRNIPLADLDNKNIYTFENLNTIMNSRYNKLSQFINKRNDRKSKLESSYINTYSYKFKNSAKYEIN